VVGSGPTQTTTCGQYYGLLCSVRVFTDLPAVIIVLPKKHLRPQSYLSPTVRASDARIR
jgi:hypothetical protein